MEIFVGRLLKYLILLATVVCKFFQYNSCSSNLTQLCDLCESLARVQDELLQALSTAANDGGGVGCDANAIRSRLMCGSKPKAALVRVI